MTAAWPAGDPRLERHYRRLLLAYPRGFRLRHGDELVTTLLEMAEPGRSRPAAGDGWHLFTSGIRHRFRLPAGRPLARVGVVLAALLLTAFGAAAGSWVSGQMLTALPSDDRVAALTAQVVSGAQRFRAYRSESVWDIPAPSVFSVVDAPGWTPGPSRDRLAADGWSVTAIRNLPSAAGDTQPGGQMFDATRDGVRMRVAGYVSPGAPTVSVDFAPVDTAATLPATIVGASSRCWWAGLSRRPRRAG